MEVAFVFPVGGHWVEVIPPLTFQNEIVRVFMFCRDTNTPMLEGKAGEAITEAL